MGFFWEPYLGRPVYNKWDFFEAVQFITIDLFGILLGAPEGETQVKGRQMRPGVTGKGGIPVG